MSRLEKSKNEPTRNSKGVLLKNYYLITNYFFPFCLQIYLFYKIAKYLRADLHFIC